MKNLIYICLSNNDKNLLFMQPKKKILRRITSLYIIFFVIIITSIILSLNSAAVKQAFSMGYNDAVRIQDREGEGREIDIFYDINGVRSDFEFDTMVYSNADSSVIVKGRPAAMDFEVTSHKKASAKTSVVALVFASAFIYIAIFVIIFIIISSLRKSIKTDVGFSKRNIMHTRSIAFLMIAQSLISSLSSYLESNALASYFTESPFVVDTAFRFNFAEIITGILIFVIAEIFAIGYNISEEQKLTI